jgi:hypothetical protein
LIEKLEAAGLAEQAHVRVEHAASGLQVFFDPQADVDAARLRCALAPLMQPYALRWEVST